MTSLGRLVSYICTLCARRMEMESGVEGQIED